MLILLWKIQTIHWLKNKQTKPLGIKQERYGLVSPTLLHIIFKNTDTNTPTPKILGYTLEIKYY